MVKKGTARRHRCGQGTRCQEEAPGGRLCYDGGDSKDTPAQGNKDLLAPVKAASVSATFFADFMDRPEAEVFRMSRRLQWIIVIAVVIGVPMVAYHLIGYFWRLGFVPQAMGVWHIVYNETGLIVYKMPEDVAARLEKDGLNYLEKLPAQSHGHWRGRYSDWRATPIARDQRWEWPQGQPVSHPAWTSPGIGDYLFRYGFWIPIDEDVERMVNGALFQPGSYYAYGRIGMIILVPAARRIVYAYPG